MNSNQPLQDSAPFPWTLHHYKTCSGLRDANNHQVLIFPRFYTRSTTISAYILDLIQNDQTKSKQDQLLHAISKAQLLAISLNSSHELISHLNLAKIAATPISEPKLPKAKP